VIRAGSRQHESTLDPAHVQQDKLHRSVTAVGRPRSVAAGAPSGHAALPPVSVVAIGPFDSIDIF
jgi:hypothetical protein